MMDGRFRSSAAAAAAAGTAPASGTASEIFIGMGSNLGDRAATLRQAAGELDRLPGTRVERLSRFHETAPEGPPGQGPYLNAVAQLRSDLPPRRLLEAMLAIERAHGRRRDRETRNGPRTLDLDLLLHGDLILSEAGLVLPHPRMHTRRFVLEPLAELAPRLRHPLLDSSIHSLLRAIGDRSADPAATASGGSGEPS